MVTEDNSKSTHAVSQIVLTRAQIDDLVARYVQGQDAFRTMILSVVSTAAAAGDMDWVAHLLEALDATPRRKARIEARKSNECT